MKKILYWDESLEYELKFDDFLSSKSSKFLLADHDENGRKLELGKFSSCQLAGNSVYYPEILINQGGKLISPIIEKVMSLDSNSPYESNGMKVNCNLSDPKRVELCPVFFFVYNTDNYFHFIYDTLPYLLYYFRLKEKLPSLKILMNYPGPYRDNHYDFVIESLSLLGITEEDIIICDIETLYSEIYLGSSLTHNRLSNLPPREEINEIYGRMRAAVSLTHEIKDYKKIYVSRRTWINSKNASNIGTDYTSRRVCVNEDEIAEYFQDLGYTELFCESLTMAEKISIFSNAEEVVGTIGGGMVNLLFSKPETRVFSINSPEFFNVNNRFRFAIEHTLLAHFNDTAFVDSERIKPSMRVSILDNENNILFSGEVIKKCKSNQYEIRYLNRSVAGWNNDEDFSIGTFHEDFVKPIGIGLNSRWKVSMENFYNTLREAGI